MTAADFSPVRHRPSADDCLAAIGSAAGAWKLRARLTLPSLSEKFGKQPDKDAGAAYAAGSRDPGAAGLLIAMFEDEEFANAVLVEVLNRKLCPVNPEPACHRDTLGSILDLAREWFDALAVDEDGDGDPMDRKDVLRLDTMLSALEPRFANIRARAARIRAGGA